MAQPVKTVLSFSIFLSILALSFSDDAVYNVQDYGAVSGGTQDSSNAFLQAWNAACGSGGDSTVYAPVGEFLIGDSIEFNGQTCGHKITFQIDGMLVAPLDYSALASKENWISFREANLVTVSGGAIDGKGQSLWQCKGASANCPRGANSMAFYHSSNVQINGLTSLNSQNFHILVYNSQNVGIQGINITNPQISPNTDGIHVQSSTIVTISGSHIGTGDDCISMGPGAASIWIENIFCGPGHGISIGSLGKDAEEDGVHNVTVLSATIQGTENGVRIKTWAKPSSGFVRDVTFQNVTMINAKYPIIIDQNYSDFEDDDANAVQISGVTYKQIQGTSANSAAISMQCSSNSPCSNIILQDISLTCEGQPAQASCSNVQGSTIGTVEPSGCV